MFSRLSALLGLVPQALSLVFMAAFTWLMASGLSGLQ
jgi:hypothetical protein